MSTARNNRRARKRMNDLCKVQFPEPPNKIPDFVWYFSPAMKKEIDRVLEEEFKQLSK